MAEFKHPSINTVDVDDSEVVKWVRDTQEPEDVFGEETLKKWVQQRFSPDEVFPDFELEEWAENNGYTKEDA